MIELDEKRKTDEAEGSLIDVERAERVLEGMNKGRELAKGERLYGKTLLTDETPRNSVNNCRTTRPSYDSRAALVERTVKRI